MYFFSVASNFHYFVSYLPTVLHKGHTEGDLCDLMFFYLDKPVTSCCSLDCIGINVPAKAIGPVSSAQSTLVEEFFLFITVTRNYHFRDLSSIVTIIMALSQGINFLFIRGDCLARLPMTTFLRLLLSILVN